MLWRTVLAAAVVAASLAPGAADAGVRHRQRHGAHARVRPHRHAWRHGAACAPGLWFRPSSGSCGRAPYAAHAWRGRIVHAVHAPRRRLAARPADAPGHAPAPPSIAPAPASQPAARATAYTPPEGLGWVGAFRRPQGLR